MTKDEITSYFTLRLKNAGILNYKQEFIWLACYALKVTSVELMAAKDDFFNLNYEKLNSVITRRENGEPLQYIIGEADFYGRDFIIGVGALIPRRVTESLINAVIYLFKDKNQNFKFLDWGTGTGCIAVTILLEFKNSFAFMLDKSPKALSYAKKNLKRYNLEDRAELLLTPQNINFAPNIIKNQKFDFLISNPPYIPTLQINNLMREVKNYEPHMALDGGADGLDYYKILFQYAPVLLHDNGLLILEIGDDEQAKFLKNFHKNFKFIKSFPDSSGFSRCMVWRLY